MALEKSVFISYRRETSTYQARAVYQALKALGYDPFLDYETIDSGAFERVILNQIAARAHFVLVLAPGALDRTDTPGDWLRREVEHAIDLKRNIVALMFGGFDMSEVPTTGKFAKLRDYNALPVYPEYFDEAIARLAQRFLNVPLDAVLHPTPAEDEAFVEQQQAEAEAAPPVTEEQLSAEEFLLRGNAHYKEKNFDAALTDYTRAIGLNPAYAMAYHNRGIIWRRRGEQKHALEDFERAVKFNPDYPRALYQLGVAYGVTGDYPAAKRTLDRLLKKHPKYYSGYFYRGYVHEQLDDFDGAVADLQRYLDAKPADASGWNNLAWTRYRFGDFLQALKDADRSIELRPDDANTYDTRGWVWLSMEMPEQALEDFNQAIWLDPTESTFFLGRGHTHLALGDRDAAQADLHAALDALDDPGARALSDHGQTKLKALQDALS